MKVVLLCRDHLDNILFDGEVRNIDDEIRFEEECRKYSDDTWVDYTIEDDGTKLPWWDHAISLGLAENYIELRKRERQIYGFWVLTDTDELIQTDDWGE